MASGFVELSCKGLNARCRAKRRQRAGTSTRRIGAATVMHDKRKTITRSASKDVAITGAGSCPKGAARRSIQLREPALLAKWRVRREPFVRDAVRVLSR